MRRAEILQEVRKMRFEEAYGGWTSRRLSQEEAAVLLGVCSRTFRRYINRYDDYGLEGILDKRLTQASFRRAPVDEVMAVSERYRTKHMGWNVKHFYSWYQREGGRRSYAWVKNTLQSKGLVSKVPKRGVHRKRRDRAPIPGMMLHQDGSSHEWVLGKKWDLIVTMDAANRYLARMYMPAFNAEFMQPAAEEGTAFIKWIGANLDDVLCEQHERTVTADNCVSFEGITLQIPADRYRCHYVKVRVRIHRYMDGSVAIFHGPRKLADYDKQGKLKETKKKKAA